MEVQTHTFLTWTLDYTPRDKRPLHLSNGMLGGTQGQSERFGGGTRDPAENKFYTVRFNIQYYTDVPTTCRTTRSRLRFVITPSEILVQYLCTDPRFSWWPTSGSAPLKYSTSTLWFRPMRVSTLSYRIHKWASSLMASRRLAISSKANVGFN